MPETLKKLREPAALAAVLFAGLALLVAVINLLAPPSSNGFSEPFANRAHDQVGSFLDVVVAAAAAFAVYLAQHVAPALAKARLVTMVALAEMGVALLFGVVTVLAQFGADGVGGEGKFLTFLLALGQGAVVAVAALFVWQTWQILNPQAPRPTVARPGQFGGGWTGGPGGPGQQQYTQPAPPPGGFGWAPQQGGQPQPGQSGPTAFGQQAQGGPAAAQTGSDRTQLLPPVQGQQNPASPAFPQPPMPPQPGAGVSGTGAHAPQPPALPMQDYAAQPSPWSPAGTGIAPPAAPAQGQQIPSARAEEPEQRPGPFQIGDWHAE
ncbi:hypothetical protein KGA66_01795 [Actinocrinis puniceicyclus]|uniref:Uncharacterized protein n=1 Tax=Actinocrinis puniceicyclus TaxID=977794 RepID=A0A8J8BA66_9ACTN|nr:hypothetical protein [Actinocrinis puniceicyclus]MBS2961763.1 hypothetical protein [Actinocrinis puniceicyclus]